MVRSLLAELIENAVYMTEAKYERLAAVLKKKKNIILQGAPGCSALMRMTATTCFTGVDS